MIQPTTSPRKPDTRNISFQVKYKMYVDRWFRRDEWRIIE